MLSINIGSEYVTGTPGSPAVLSMTQNKHVTPSTSAHYGQAGLDDMQSSIRENGLAGVSLYVVAGLVPLLDNYVD